LMSEISQTCSQLIHTRFVVFFAGGLETRNQLRKRQEKNEFNFQFRPKNSVLRKVCEPAATDSGSPQRTDFAADWLRIPS
jgi:hypothetical protein